MSKKKEQNESLRFEDALDKLETIVKQLERGELPLEESLTLFAEGVALSKACLSKLSLAEKQIDHVLQLENGQITQKEFVFQEDKKC